LVGSTSTRPSQREDRFRDYGFGNETSSLMEDDQRRFVDYSSASYR